MDKLNRPIKKPSYVIGAYRQWHYELGLSHLETRIILEASKGYESGELGILYHTQTGLADQYGTTRQGLHRTLKTLKELDLITVSNGLIRPSEKTILLSNLKNKTQRGM